MRGIGIFGLSLLAGCAGLCAASFWSGSAVPIDETIADSKTGTTGLQALEAEIPFAQFRYPHVDRLENVTFIVDPPKNHGIYRSSAVNRRLSELVTSKETKLPDSGAAADYIRGLQTDGDDFVFNATDAQDQRGLYFWRNGALQTIARTSETISGEANPLTDVGYGSLSDGNVLFTAQTSLKYALVLQNVETRTSRVLLRSGDPIPGQTGATFEYFSPQNWIQGEDVVFRAARVRDPYDKEDHNIEGVRGIYGWFGVTAADPAGFSLKNLRTIADWTTPIPGMEGHKFTDFRSTPVCKGVVAFVGSGKGCSGVYLYDAYAKDKRPRVIVDTETRLPALFEGTFRDFGIFPTVFDDCVVFTAQAGDDYAGVFLYNAGTDTLFRLADNRTPINGKTAAGFEIAGHFLVRNRFAITASFSDRSYGVYLATIPVEGFTRMGAPGL